MSEKSAGLIGTFVVLLYLAMLLGACSASGPEVQTRVVQIPSSKPYKFIRWSREDTPETIAQARRHNSAHQAVINAENAKR